MAGTLEVPPRHSYLSDPPPPFQNLGLKVVPPAERGGGGDTVVVFRGYRNGGGRQKLLRKHFTELLSWKISQSS